VTWVAYDFSDGGSMAHSMPRPSTSFSIFGGVEKALK
jgi:hypothetical protein